MIVEDDIDMTDFLRAVFESEHFAVDTEKSGDRGSYLARTNEYDAVILDNILPNRSGIEVCQDIRKHGKTMPILVLSAVSTVAEKVAFLNAGADDYMTKPFVFQELLARVKALLRRPAALVEEVLCMGTLEVDSRQHTVRRAGQSISLTRKEFMILEYLLRNRGKIVSRSSIMEHVWDRCLDPFSNTVEAHISSLRKKMHASGSESLIHTVSGVGYGMGLRGKAYK